MLNKVSTKISIVGAGPGDPELLTLKGLRAIQSADVILYDALSGMPILEFARTNTKKIYVGKRCGKHSVKQPDINALMYQLSTQYRNIVRLKGGDPFIFGRGHEELSYLKKKGIDVEVIPGISSVTSLPLLQHVPLTRRNISESFWVLTGTTKHHRLSEDIFLAAKSNATIVILMGMRKLKEICSLFKRENKDDMPVMIISQGSTNEEKVALGTINDISERAQIKNLKTPGIIIVGEVVRLHPEYIYQYAINTWA